MTISPRNRSLCIKTDLIYPKTVHTKLINNKIVKCGSVLCLDKENLFSINQRKSVKIQSLRFQNQNLRNGIPRFVYGLTGSR